MPGGGPIVAAWRPINYLARMRLFCSSLGLLFVASCGDVATTTIDAAGLPDAAIDAATGCSSGLLACGADCIDPTTDNLHCGANADCGAGHSGSVCLGDSTCADGACAYLPVGPQLDVPVADLVGWTLCYSDTYGNAGTTIASILAGCGGDDLLLACRPTGTPTLALLAWADRATITTDTGEKDTATTTVANGTAWYFNTNWSWGFAPEGEAVSKNSCDTNPGGGHLCWHTGNGTINEGYRCGDPSDLSTNYERLVYTR